MNPLCPNCKEANGERTATESLDSGGLVFTFECRVCEEVWKVAF